MGEQTNISWTDHTFNPWIGCTKVSPGCANCYAAAQDKLRKWTPEGWGKGQPRKRTSAANWRKPLQWNKTEICCECGKAVPRGNQHVCTARNPDNFTFSDEVNWRRPRVFCASLADWLDDEMPIEWLADLLKLIHDTRNLDWQLLTKRPENFSARILAASFHLLGYRDGQTSDDPVAPAHTDACEMAAGWSKLESFPQNVWIGTSCEDQKRTDERIPHLLKIPAKVRFISAEPLLGITNLIGPFDGPIQYPLGTGIHWVIAGGESGPGHRAMDLDALQWLYDDCKGHDCAFFCKQDSGPKPGKQGRIPDNIWNTKQFPA